MTTSPVKQIAALAAGGALALGLSFWAGTAFAQEKGNGKGQAKTSPVRLDANRMAGLGLTAIPPDAYKDILVAGQLNMRVANLFSGKELRAEIFESTPAKTDHRTRPTPSDEFVYVLSGKLILTEPGGTVHEFLPGNSLVLPAGYTGTWEMQGNYREIAVVKSGN